MASINCINLKRSDFTNALSKYSKISPMVAKIHRKIPKYSRASSRDRN